MFLFMSARIAPANFNRHTDLSALDAFLDSFRKARSSLLAAGEGARRLRRTAKVARSQAQPAASGPVLRVETFESDYIQLRHPPGGRCGDGPGQENGRQESGRPSSGVQPTIHIGPQQIRPHAALFHLSLHRRRGYGRTDGDRFVLAKLVLEDAQGFVERSDEEIDDGAANGLLLRGGVCGCNERGGAGDIGRDDEGAALLIYFSGIEEAAAEARFSVCARSGDQLCVGLGYARDKIENLMRWRS